MTEAEMAIGEPLAERAASGSQSNPMTGAELGMSATIATIAASAQPTAAALESQASAKQWPQYVSGAATPASASPPTPAAVALAVARTAPARSKRQAPAAAAA